MDINIKPDLDVSTADFWDDVCNGELDPFEICASEKVADKICDAIDLVREFQQACEDSIENFYE